MDGVEIRCPEHPIRLLLKVEKPVLVNDGGANMIEIACKDCRTQLRREGVRVDLVVHRYNVVGEWLETIVR